eukprot:TRINITY_DN576_c0_g1_i1.p1 TRINITY_DN576_c0_g1~~TRINITY_DN576_c0_g1_i1.p1  ORF type:complete len:407 (-),score=69.04 TRINITY_DN576_c0_g1_i1:143-1363(-)
MDSRAPMGSPYLVSVVDDSYKRAGIRFFQVRLLSHGGFCESQARRRYSDFEALRDGLTRRHVILPPLPPKSFLLMMVSKSFREDRCSQLLQFLQAALQSDPLLDFQELRLFCGLTQSPVKVRAAPLLAHGEKQTAQAFAQEAATAFADAPAALAQHTPANAQQPPAACVPDPATFAHPVGACTASGPAYASQAQPAHSVHEALSDSYASQTHYTATLSQHSFKPTDKSAQCTMSMQEALTALGQTKMPVNWVLLESSKLGLHMAGCGGLEDMKSWLLSDKVMFGIVKLLFPRRDGPPIEKQVFIHWIGSAVPPVQRGHWNSNLDEAASVVRIYCDFSLRRTAYELEDLDLSDLITELSRLTYDKDFGDKKLSLDWYMQGLEDAQAYADVEVSTAVSEASDVSVVTG